MIPYGANLGDVGSCEFGCCGAYLRKNIRMKNHRNPARKPAAKRARKRQRQANKKLCSENN